MNKGRAGAKKDRKGTGDAAAIGAQANASGHCVLLHPSLRGCAQMGTGGAPRERRADTHKETEPGQGATRGEREPRTPSGEGTHARKG